MFSKALKYANGDTSKIKSIWSSLQVSYSAEQLNTRLTAKGICKKTGKFILGIVTQVCADFNEVLIETLSKVLTSGKN